MNATKDALKGAKGFKYDRNAMTWASLKEVLALAIVELT
jgi:hypothetical protein